MSRPKLKQVHQSGASSGEVPKWDGSAWVPGTVTGLGAGRMASFATTVGFGDDEQTGTVSGLSPTPIRVGGFAICETGVVVQSGIRYGVQVTKMNADGFDWVLRLHDEEYWPEASAVSLNIDYVWSET